LQDPDDLRWASALAERELTRQISATLGLRRKDGEIFQAEVVSSMFSNEDGEERCLVTLWGAGVSPLTGIPSVADGRLTEAELRVLQLLPTHYSQSQIAQMLFLGRNTVKTHTIAIYRKLAVRDRASAVTQARTLGILRTTTDRAS